MKEIILTLGALFMSGLGMSGCHPTVQYIQFEHVPSKGFYESNDIQSASLAPFWDREVLFAMHTYRAIDDGFGLTLFLYSPQKKRTVFIQNVEIFSKTWTVTHNISQQMNLTDRVEGLPLWGTHIVLGTPLTHDYLPDALKEFSAVITYILDGKEKQMLFKIEGVKYKSSLM